MKIALHAIDNQKKWMAATVGYVCFCILYILTGRVHLRAPLEIAPSSIDRLIPFVDWTVWVYHSQFFFLAFCVWAMRKPENISRAL
ncbi:MAG TPA: hypothetical protein VNO70_05280, partial [Blastocatellia bacterium]|nr:hypothetical protein [Blastocatellia bacterium]